MVEEIAPFEAKSEAFLRKQPGGRFAIARADEITFTTHLVARSPFLREFCRHPVFCDLVHDLIGPDVRLYWDQAVYKKPGTRAPFPWHQDNGYTFVEPEAYLTCWVALTDATRDNGCPRVVPGLHRGGTLAHRADRPRLHLLRRAAEPAGRRAGARGRNRGVLVAHPARDRART